MANGNAVRFCMCVMPKDVSAETRRTMSGRKAALLNAFMWATASVISVRFLDGDGDLQRRVRTVAERWTAPGMADVTFDFVQEREANIRIGFVQGAGSWSFIGTHCQSIGEP